MLLIDTLLIGVIAIAIFNKKRSSNTEQTELVPIPVSEEELKVQKTNE